MDELVESNDIVEDSTALRARLRRDGYVFVRGLIDRQRAIDALQSPVPAKKAPWC